MSIADVALFVSNWADRPVVDKTDLDGLFNIQTEGWMRAEMPPPGQEPTADPPTLFEIFDRLGLNLESQKGPVETLSSTISSGQQRIKTAGSIRRFVPCMSPAMPGNYWMRVGSGSNSTFRMFESELVDRCPTRSPQLQWPQI